MRKTFIIGQTTLGDALTRFFITDASDENLDTRPFIAEFPISEAYPMDHQLQRAKDYCRYLNKLEEAAQVAYEQTHLMDILKR